jgi:hypothetical protein
MQASKFTRIDSGNNMGITCAVGYSARFAVTVLVWGGNVQLTPDDNVGKVQVYALGPTLASQYPVICGSRDGSTNGSKHSPGYSCEFRGSRRLRTGRCAPFYHNTGVDAAQSKERKLLFQLRQLEQLHLLTH